MNAFNTESVSRKALTYLICNDIIKAAISTLGSAGSADKFKTDNVVADKVIEAAKDKKGE